MLSIPLNPLNLPPLLFLPLLTNPDSDSLSSQNHPSLSDGEEQLERLQQAELTRSKPMSLWRAVTVQAWLEVVMAMPMYMRACSENVKSGKVNASPLHFFLFFSYPVHF